MIRTYHEDNYTEYETLLTALGLDVFSAPIISVVGAGGKTTVIERLSREYMTLHQPVIVTTTTHMKCPDVPYLLGAPDMIEFARIIRRQRIAWLGIPDGEGKIGAFPMAFLEAVRILGIPMLIEADGAKEKPCKVPAAHEPVLWGKTTTVIGVFGLDAVGRTIEEACHRPEPAAALLCKSAKERITCGDIVTIGLSEQGMKKNMDPFMRYRIVLNKADTKERLEYAKEITGLFAGQGFCDVITAAGLGGSHADIDQRSR